jgi:hypothetical protein
MAALVLHGNCRRLFNVGGKMPKWSALVAASSPECRPSRRALRCAPYAGPRGILLLFLGACSFLFSVATFAQQRAGGNLSVPPSDLASDNQQRVAASEAQIVACHVLPQMRSMRSSQVQGRALFIRVFRGWDRCDSDGKLRFGNEDEPKIAYRSGSSLV